MPDPRGSFPTLEGDGHVAIALDAALEGAALSGKYGSIGFCFKDDSGNLLLAPIKASGASPDNFLPTLGFLSSGGLLVAPSLTAAGALKVDGSGATQPVSGTVAATQSGSWTVTANLGTIAGVATETTLASLNTKIPSGLTVTSTRLLVDGSGVTQPISAASLPLPLGASTSALQTSGNASLTSIDSKTPALGQALAAASVPVVLTAAQLTTLTPLTTVAVTQSTSPWVVSGTVAATQSGAWAVTANAGTNLNTSALALESGGNLASVKTNTDNLSLSQGSTTSGQKGNLILGAVTTAAPTYTTAQSSPLSMTTAGAVRTDGSATTQPVSGTVTANLGTIAGVATEATLATRLSESDFDSKTGALTETAPASDTASSGLNGRLQRIAQRLTSLISLFPTSLGQKTMANSLAVVLASDQSAISVTDATVAPATYSAGAAFTLVASATDIFTITGSATKTIKIISIAINGVNTGNTNVLVNVIKRSTANTGGTSSTVTGVPNDSTQAAATATVRSYTVNPTLGTGVGTIRSDYAFFPVLASTNAGTDVDHSFTDSGSRPIYLRGTGEVLAINLGGTLITGTTLVACDITWTEE